MPTQPNDQYLSTQMQFYRIDSQAKNLGVWALLVLFAIGPFAASASLPASHCAFLPKDSISKKKENGRYVVLYKVEAGETLFALARKYRTNVFEIKKLNPTLGAGVNVGQTLKLPALLNAAETTAKTKQTPTSATNEKVHIVTAGQTLFAIARLYKVKVDELKEWNELTTGSLFEGQQLVVSKPPAEANGAVKEILALRAKAPDKKEAETESKDLPKRVKSEEEPTAKAGYTSHTVKPGESLFAIARTYNTTPKEIQDENKLAGQGVNVGQVLNIKVGKPLEEKPAVGLATEVNTKQGVNDDTIVQQTELNGNMGFDRIIEHGVAEVVDNDAGSRNYFCLHRSAPTGAILQIKNEMNGATIFARVIGKLPETGVNERITVKISQKAYEKLAAVEKRFPVEVSYPAH